MAAGIETRHARACRSRKGGRCDCTPTYRAHVWDGKERHRRTFKSEAEARSWRKDARVALRRGQNVEKAFSDSLETVAEAWLEGARNGTIRTRSGDVYKPAAVRSYEAALRLRLYPAYGSEPLADIRRVDLQELVEKWLWEGLAPSTIEATLTPLRAIIRREANRGRIAVNPTVGLELPRGETPRDRIADPQEAAKLLAAVPEQDRPLWATAMYAGLRRGELKALRANRVDLEAGLIRVESGWDDREGEIETKGGNRRNVPIPDVLREHLVAQLIRSGRRDAELLFGRAPRAPFDYRRTTDRADEAWKAANLKRITFHECRHSYASYSIAAGVNAKALSTYMGHANIGITLDRYGHLMPGNEEEAAGLLDSYLERAKAGRTELAFLASST
jgi:integrase